MFSYFPKGINDTKPQQVIDIEVCKLLIQNNIKKDVIQNIWSLEYRSSDYTKTKALLPYITPHGTFLKNREDACLDKFSGLLYFDVDDVVIDIELYKSQLIQKYKTVK